MRQHRKDEYMHEALGKLSVVEGAYARNKAQHSRQPRTCRTHRSNIHSGGSIRGRGRNCALEAGCEAVLTVDHSAHIALATLAEGLSAGTAIRGCGLIGVNGASHAIKLLLDS